MRGVLGTISFNINTFEPILLFSAIRQYDEDWNKPCRDWFLKVGAAFQPFASMMRIETTGSFSPEVRLAGFSAIRQYDEDWNWVIVASPDVVIAFQPFASMMRIETRPLGPAESSV